MDIDETKHDKEAMKSITNNVGKSEDREKKIHQASTFD